MTTSDKEWRQVAKNDNEWQRMIKQMRVSKMRDFKFQNKTK